MNHSLVQRLVGALVLLVLCAVLWPYIFKTPEQANRDIASQIPDAPTLEVFEIPRERRPELLASVPAMQESLREPVAPAKAILDDPQQDVSFSEPVEAMVTEEEVTEEAVVESLTEELAITSPEVEITTETTTEGTKLTPADVIEPETVADDEDGGPVSSKTQPPVPEALAQLDAKPVKSYDLPVKSVQIKPNPSGKMWALQVGAFGEAANAQAAADKYRAMGYPAVIQQRIPNERTLHFVFVGPYINEDDAYTDLLLLEKQSIKAIVVNFRP